MVSRNWRDIRNRSRASSQILFEMLYWNSASIRGFIPVAVQYDELIIEY
jgi:hypothetical protein